MCKGPTPLQTSPTPTVLKISDIEVMLLGMKNGHTFTSVLPTLYNALAQGQSLCMG